MSSHAWRCPDCREPLGSVTTWGYRRRHYSQLTTTHRCRSVDTFTDYYIVHCRCGGRKRFDGGRVVQSHRVV